MDACPMRLDLTVRAWRDEPYRADRLVIYSKNGDKENVVTGWTLTEIDPNKATPSEATLDAREGGLQSLFEDLWHMGYRPRESKLDQATALEAHIKDLQETKDRLLNMIDRVVR